MLSLTEKKMLLPEFPRTPHLPHRPNVSKDDLIASNDDAAIVFSSPYVTIEEKVDGASVGLMMDAEGNPVIRNSEHILNKGYVKKSTPAKLQFRPLWNFFYDNIKKFKELQKHDLSVYAEWMLMQHGLEYDQLNSWLITYDLFDHNIKKFLSPDLSRGILRDAGFEVVPLLHAGRVESFEQLDALVNASSQYTTKGHREGIYIKLGDGKWLTHRFKLVRSDFKQGSLFDDTVLKKNSLRK